MIDGYCFTNLDEWKQTRWQGDVTAVEFPPRSGFCHVPGFLSAVVQTELLDAARSICADAPLARPELPNGQPLRLTLTNCGALGWWSDGQGGYRYTERHPRTGKAWPPIPQCLLDLAESALATVGLPPMRIDNCLINHYAQDESLGLHVDRTEQDKTAPIISMSIGAEAEFILQDADGVKHSTILRSGDLAVQSGRSRGWLHGIKRVMPTMPNTCRDGGRINFTLRKVKLP